MDESDHILQYWDGYDEPGYMRFNYPEIIFDHDFAKALWGDNLNVTEQIHHWASGDVTRAMLKNWQLYLQQMVIAEDPIKYLGEHL